MTAKFTPAAKCLLSLRSKTFSCVAVVETDSKSRGITVRCTFYLLSRRETLWKFQNPRSCSIWCSVCDRKAGKPAYLSQTRLAVYVLFPVSGRPVSCGFPCASAAFRFTSMYFKTRDIARGRYICILNSSERFTFSRKMLNKLQIKPRQQRALISEIYIRLESALVFARYK